MNLSKDNLDHAFDQLLDFHSVNYGGKGRDPLAATIVLLDSFGFDDERRSQLTEKLGQIGGVDEESPVMLGMLIVLLAFEYDT